MSVPPVSEGSSAAGARRHAQARAPATPSERDLHRLDAAEPRPSPPCQRFRGVAHFRQLAKERLDRDFSFQAREMGSDAEMVPCAEGQDLPLARPRDVKAVGVLENARIAVSGAKHENDDLPLAERLAVKLDVIDEHARG